jgi:DNA-binding PadR family transcriptional regulator
MSTATRRRWPRPARTLWSLAVLGLLRERPMHPYEMQRQLHVRHTDEMLGLKRGSLYHAIGQLQRADLIEPVETSREGRWPERTVYRITDAGEDEMVLWVRDLLATPVREPSSFMAALAHTLQLEPGDALDQLQLRIVNLEATIAAYHAVERRIGERVGRAAILEVEFACALAEAELNWVRATIDDLETGRLNWSFEKIKQRIHNDHDDHIEIKDSTGEERTR